MAQPSTNSRRHRQSGHALLEAALVAAPLLILILGIFDIGQMLYIQQTLSERVRAAARYGAVHSTDLPAVQNMVLYGDPRPSGAPFLGLKPADVQVARQGRGTPDDRLQITVIGWRHTVLTPFLAGSRDTRSLSASIPVESAE